MREILAGLDIGSNEIKLVVAELSNEKFNVLLSLSEVSRGVNKGAICEVDQTAYSIQKIIKKAEEILSFKLTKAIVTVNEESCDFKVGESSIKITDEDKEITGIDIGKVLKASTVVNKDKNMELVTVMPIVFSIDDKKTKNPKFLKGSTLGVRSVVMSVPRKEVFLVAKTLEKCGIEVIDINIPSLANYFAHRSELSDAGTGCIIDVGAETTNIGIVNKGIVINNNVLKVGGNDIDKDIAYVYKTNLSDAKKLKEILGRASKRNASVKEVETIITETGEKVEVNSLELSNVIISRLREILKMAKNEINYLTKKEISYIIITGGLTELKDFDLEVESVFGKNARVGDLNIIGARDGKYSSCIGMLKYFDYKLKLRDSEFSMLTKDEEEILSGSEKRISESSLLGKVFGLFFDN